MGKYLFGTLAFLATTMTVPVQAGNVYVVDYESGADLKVYYVDCESGAEGKDALWYLVDYESGADVKVYFVDYESGADLKIYVIDYESGAGWNKSHPWQGKLH